MAFAQGSVVSLLALSPGSPGSTTLQSADISVDYPLDEDEREQSLAPRVHSLCRAGGGGAAADAAAGLLAGVSLVDPASGDEAGFSSPVVLLRFSPDGAL